MRVRGSKSGPAIASRGPTAGRRRLAVRILGVLALAMFAGACEADNPFEPCPVYSTGVVGGCAFDPDDSE